MFLKKLELQKEANQEVITQNHNFLMDCQKRAAIQQQNVLAEALKSIDLNNEAISKIKIEMELIKEKKKKPNQQFRDLIRVSRHVKNQLLKLS